MFKLPILNAKKFEQNWFIMKQKFKTKFWREAQHPAHTLLQWEGTLPVHTPPFMAPQTSRFPRLSPIHKIPNTPLGEGDAIPSQPAYNNICP